MEMLGILAAPMMNHHMLKTLAAATVVIHHVARLYFEH